jgi:hypothetical protein
LPEVSGQRRREWLAAREADLLPVPYFHVVFTFPAAIANIAYQNKAVIYDILVTASAETMANEHWRLEPLTNIRTTSDSVPHCNRLQPLAACRTEQKIETSFQECGKIQKVTL